MPDIGADTMYANATEKGTIDTIPEIPGLAVWHEGHIGIYIGGGKVIEAMGTKYGVVETELAGRGWTHWLKVPYITYLDTEMSSSANEKHIWDTLYAKIGNPYGNGEEADPNYIESPYSQRSFYDFKDNIISIQNSLYGGRPEDRNENSSIMSYLKKYNPDLAEKMETDLNAAISALEDCQNQLVGGFVNNPTDPLVGIAQDKIYTLDDDLQKAGEWFARQ